MIMVASSDMAAVVVTPQGGDFTDKKRKRGTPEPCPKKEIQA